MLRVLFSVGCVWLLVACVAMEKKGGYVFNDRAMAYVRVGETDKQDVLRALGSPSATSNFEVERWHYISKTEEVVSVLDPELTSQKVVSIEFDAHGVVQKIDTHSEADAKEIELVDRETKSEGTSISAIEQLLGNFGRFNNAQQGGRNSGPGRGVPSPVGR